MNDFSIPAPLFQIFYAKTKADFETEGYEALVAGWEELQKYVGGLIEDRFGYIEITILEGNNE